jgi:predicted dehydrogenase
MRVAVLGASGIGKNHARWFKGHGCEIVAFLGSSPDKVEGTTQLLRDGIGFTGRGYTDLDELLTESRPDIVCISNPPRMHYEHVVKSFEAGAHVLCEKPLVGDDTRADSEVIAEAQALCDIARQHNRLLGTQMQYATAAPLYLELAGIPTNADGATVPITSWSMEMESKMVRPGRGARNIWIDLSPHPLSVLQKIAVGAEIEWNSVQCCIEKMESNARFTVWFPGQAEPCAANVTVRCNPERDVPLRRFSINGHTVDCAARKNEAGEFKAFFRNEAGTEIERPDLVDSLIGNFVAACRGDAPMIVTGDDGAQNVEWQLRILSHATNG